jgi:hypothetical protein
MNAPDRAKFIGGSDAAAVLGLSPWRTPLQLYLAKRGELPPPTDEDRKRERVLARGKREEPHIVDDLVELYAVKVVRRSTTEQPNYHVHPAVPYIAAEIDFEWEVTEEAIERLATRGIEIPYGLIGTVQNGECKTAHPFVASKKFGEEGTDEIPVEYGAQAMHGLMVTGRAVTLVAVAVYVDDPLLYLVRRDEETIVEMLEREEAFMEKHVAVGVPPDPLNVPDVQLLLGRKEETRKDATPEIAALVSSLETLRDRESATKEAIEALKFEIGSFLVGAEAVGNPKEMGAHVLRYQGAPILRVVLEEKTFVDATKLRVAYPEIAKECTRTTSSFAYRKPRKGSK